ncbi:glycosyltransferase family 2 protein [uncultured Prevotella sp.]|uniref:glycosyltransferase family 2 protein n=1 Tax=uncultured Prevotella sp. TaxID=159272 RepID=UPI0025875302|nr:glycosyltransferase family 2 protein [uncultured Prevotella sp.]
MEIRISIITINYNGLKDTCELIESLPLEDLSIEVIVVDNASNKDEATIITNRYPQVKVIRSEQNLGFAGGNNLGIKAAQGKYILFINNDTILRCKKEDVRCKMFFQPLTDRLESSPEIGMVCPKIRFAWENHPIQFAGYTPLSRYTMRNHSIGFGEKDRGQYDTAHPTPYAHGAAMMVKREALEKVGLMPECYFLYYEELDWSMMFTRAGYSIWYEPACTIYHKESQATGQNSPQKTYYLTRNRLLFVKRNIQGLQRYITYTYLLLIVAPRDICKYILHRQYHLASATIKGILNFQLSLFNFQLKK